MYYCSHIMANPICKGFRTDEYFKLGIWQLHTKNKDLLVTKNCTWIDTGQLEMPSIELLNFKEE